MFCIGKPVWIRRALVFAMVDEAHSQSMSITLFLDLAQVKTPDQKMLENGSNSDLKKKIYIDVSSWVSLIWKSPMKNVLDLKPFECHVDVPKVLHFRAIWILDFWTRDAEPVAHYVISANPAQGCSRSHLRIGSSHFSDLEIRKQKSHPKSKQSW